MMNLNDFEFPVYRMYTNGLTWIRIDSPTKFTEIRKIGARYELSEYEAKILPDRNHIMDLLIAYEPFALEISSDVFDKVAVLATK